MGTSRGLAPCIADHIQNPLGKTTTLAYDDVGRRESVTNPLGQTTTTAYDDAGRVEASINPLGFRTTFTYDGAGRRTLMTDAEGRVTTTSYDDAGRVEATIDALGHRTTIQYDDAGRREVLIDANGRRTTFQYDDAGNATVETDPLGRKTTFTYTALNQLETRLDARGALATFSYDEVGRLEGQAFTDGTRYTFTFDEVGNRETMVDSTGTTTYAYDALDRASSVVNPENQQITYAYDQAGNRSGMTGLGGAFLYACDGADRLETVLNPYGETTTFQYDDANRVLQIQQNGGHVVTTFGYDAAGQVTGITYQNAVAPATLEKFTYLYDDVGNREVVQELGGAVTTYAYDDADRLVSEQRTGGNDYHTTHTYDPVGNRTVEETGGARTTYAYDEANQLSGGESPNGSQHDYQYDAAGNLTLYFPGATVDIRTYAWNDDNRLTKVTPYAGDATTMVYDADGRRVRKIDGGGTTKFIWDRESLLAETDHSDVLQAYYTHAPRLYGELLSQRRGAATRFTLADALGSIIALAQPGGGHSDAYRYKGYGDILTSSGFTANPHRWVGRLGYYFDAGLDSHYVRQRHFRSVIAAWLNRDRAGFDAGDPNLYRYVFNRPTRLTDPTGLLIPAFLGIPGVKGCLAGAGWSLGTGLVFGGDQTLCKNFCRALLGCLAGIVSELFISGFKGSTRCAVATGAGAISFLGAELCDAYCDECFEPGDLVCSFLKSLFFSLTGCLLGEVPLTTLEAWLARFDTAFGSYLAGAACDIVPGPPIPNPIPDEWNPLI